MEFFPSKTPEGVENLQLVRRQLYAMKPEFCSLTFGAGGSTQEGTFNTVRDILAEGVSAASHFSCIGATCATVRAQLAALKAMGVKRLVALRGDLPSVYGAGSEFYYASDLVAFIRRPSHRPATCRPLPPKSRRVPIRLSPSVSITPMPTSALSESWTRSA